MVQITIIRIEDYGPWTLTLGSDREHELQILQSKLYGDLQMLFSKKNALVFFNRFDEMFAVTNGMSIEEHTEILKRLSTAYELDISMSIGRGKTPYEAHLDAHRARSENAPKKQFKVYGIDANNADDFVQIMHVDVDGSTSKVSSKLTPYEFSALITKLYSKLSEHFMDKGALTFYLGGDNFMIISNDLSKDETHHLLESVTDGTDLKLKCGIGVARSAREAAKLATKALDAIRDMRKSGKTERVFELSCI